MSKTRAALFLVGVCALVWLGAETTAAAEEGLSVEMAFTQQIAKNKPVDPQTTFAPSRVYAWTLIKGGKGAFKITHVWYKNDRQVFTHTNNVRGGRYPTWSFVHVTVGEWKVEVADEAGQVIHSGTFSVKRPPAN